VIQEPSGIFKGIRTKVFVGFGVVLFAVCVAAIINFVALSKMSNSVSILSEPDKKTIRLRALLGHLSNEEISVRAFSLTGDSQYLKLYHAFVDSAHAQLATLQTLIFYNDRELQLADSITLLAAQREVVLNSFLENRGKAMDRQEKKLSELTQKKFSGKEMKPIHAGNSPIAAESYSTDSIPAERIIVPAQNKADDVKSFFIFDWLKNFFGSNERKDEEEAAAKAKSPAWPFQDSHINSTTQQINAVVPVPKSLPFISPIIDTSAIQEMKSWSADELVLLQKNKKLMEQIRNKVNTLELTEEREKSEQAAEAKQNAINAAALIGVITILGLIGTLIFISLILRDVTRSNRLRTQLENERRRAEKLAKVKEEFLANMSHEIRTPLNVIIGFSEQLAKDVSQEKSKEFVNAIQKSSGHLLSIVNQILDYSKLEAGGSEREDISFSVHDLIHEVFESFRWKAAECGLLFSFFIDEKIPEILRGSAVSVKQILINLVSNAIKFTEQGSVIIHVSLEEENENSVIIAIQVRDTGIGIAPAALGKIFSAFTQSNGEITRKYGGTGLGLAITKKLSESLGGTIDVNSELTVGSVFTVRVPFRKSTQKTQNEESADTNSVPDSQTFFANKHILIVDDEEMNVKLCEIILENLGMKTRSASDGKEALEKFQNENFDLVLLDIQMPEMSGFEVVKSIRSLDDKLQRQIPVIALTANLFAENENQYAEAGFSDHLTKPFTEKQLLEKLEKFLPQGTMFSSKVESQNSSFKSNGKRYSLKYLEETSGANKEFISEMLGSFIANNNANIRRLHRALEEADYNSIHNVAHKMIPSFRYLELRELEAKLRSLELLAINADNIPASAELINQITLDSEALFPLLKNEIEELMNEKETVEPVRLI